MAKWKDSINVKLNRSSKKPLNEQLAEQLKTSLSKYIDENSDYFDYDLCFAISELEWCETDEEIDDVLDTIYDWGDTNHNCWIRVDVK